MRSVPADSFERISSLESLWQAWKRYRQGKRRQPRIARFAIDADRHILLLHEAMVAGQYAPGALTLRVIQDPKVRLISAAPVRDRVVHEALIRELAPHYERSFIHHSYGWGQGRGPHRAALVHLGWMRRYRYRMGLDVAGYFAAIRHDTLRALIARRLRDERTLALWDALVATGGAIYSQPMAAAVVGVIPPGQGLAIGTWLSQWAANLYLDGLDHFVKRELKIGAYLRFMDDFTLLADDVAVLEAAREHIAVWLAAERGLRLNPRKLTIQSTSAPCTWLGYRASRAGLSPGRKMRRRMKVRLPAAAERGPAALEWSLRAYRGLVEFG